MKIKLQLVPAVLFCFLALQVQAQTIRYVKVGGAGTKNGLSWANASDDFQATVNASAINDQVWVAAGTYIPTTDMSYSMKEGVKIYGGFPAVGNPAWANRDDKNNVTTLGAYVHWEGVVLIGNRVINNDNNGLTAAALLDGFTISGGLLETTGNGAGMYNNNVSPTISNCIFYNNKTGGGSGGGVHNNGGAPAFVNCTFSANQTDYAFAGYDGGGGMANISSNPTLVNCTFSGNRAIQKSEGGTTGGGAMYNASNSNPVCTNCVFSGNDAYFGGAVFNSLSNPVFNRCSFTGNTGVNGAVTNNYTPTPNAHAIVQFNSCIFTNNVAATYGGVAYNDYSNDETFTNCVFLGNRSYAVAAVVYNNSSTSVFINCTLIGNTTNQGEKYIILNRENTTLNKVDIGLYNTVLYGNSGGILFQENPSMSVNGEIKNSLVQNYELGSRGVSYFSATNNVDSTANPLFIDIANPAGADGIWGTADDGLRLQPCSPLINAGNNTFLPAGATTDITGNQRIYNGTVDIGTYESAYNQKITATTAQTNVICLTKGTATVTVSGGATPYNYVWSNGSNSAKAVNLTAGDYTCTITDANNCSLIKNFTITDASSVLTAATTQTNVVCYGSNSGMASITTVNGGAMPYTYAWSNGSDSTKAVNLTAGDYSCTITDANGCSITKNFTITQPGNPVTIAPVSSQTVCLGSTMQATYFTAQHVPTTEVCFKLNENQTQTITAPAGNIFTAVLFASYGTPYGNDCASGFGIGDCHASNSKSVVENLAIGNNSFTITASNATFGSDPCSGLPKQLYIKLSYAPVTCNWVNNNPGIGLPASGTGNIPAFTPTGAGTATITVTAVTNSGCTAAPVTFSYTVGEPPSVTTSQTNVTCYGGNGGSATIASVSGGDAPYTYLWSNGSTAETISNLTAGNYSCTITNANGCSILQNFTITQLHALTADVSQTDVSCNGGNNGSATLTVSGGTQPYTYTWSNGADVASATGLVADTYTCTITDFNGCSIVKTFTITQPDVLATYIVSQIPASGADATATIGVTGGTAPYTYVWSNGNTTATATGLSAGTYTCTVTDASHCASVNQSVTITQLALNAVTLYVDSSMVGAGSGSSWDNALKTLGDALALAAQNSNISTILVAKGTYYPTGLQNGTDRNTTFLIPQRGNLKIYGGFPSGGGTFAQRQLPSIGGAGGGTILSGDIGTTNNTNDNSYHIMVIANINNTTDSVVVDGFTLTKANGRNYNYYAYNGISIPQNNGGGMYIISGADSKIAVRNCRFANNFSGNGGGMMNANNVATLIVNCIFTGNITDDAGGGMYNESASPVVVDSRFENNTATQGGGMFNADFSSATITSCIFAGNTATDGYTIGGGGIANLSCSPTIVNSLFTGNISQGSGYGGGISNYTASPNIINCTLSGNRATINTGGGICNYNSSPIITNSIIYGNGVDIDNSSSPNGSNNSYPTLRYNIWQTVQGGFTGTGNSTVNPLFINAPSYTAAPFINGDYRLQLNSPAINAGTPDITGLNLPATDVAGNLRVQNSRIDMGAYENYVDETPLAVTLISFTAKAEGNHALLQWQTANEVNSRQFTVYRSGDDGVFVKIGEVSSGSNNSSSGSTLNPTATATTYSFTDKTPANGNNYYKLLQIDNDGTTTELGVRSLVFSLLALDFQLYPNPTNGKITVAFTSGKYHLLSLTAVNGKVLQTLSPSPLQAAVVLDLSAYPLGVYFVKLMGNGVSEIKKIVRM